MNQILANSGEKVVGILAGLVFGPNRLVPVTPELGMIFVSQAIGFFAAGFLFLSSMGRVN